MSEDSAPKLRLKPKLAADPASASPSPAPVGAPAPEPAPSAPAPADAADSKTVRLKPRLSSTPPVQVATPAPAPAAESPAPAVPATPAPAEAEKPAVKFSLRPKAAEPAPAGAPAPEAPAADAESEPPVLEAQTDTGAEGEPAEITAIQMASGAPFPPPTTVKFPTPPGLVRNLAAAEKIAKTGKRPGFSRPGAGKRMLVLAGGVVAVMLVLGGVFFAYLKFTAPPPPPPPRPRPVVQPVKPPEPPVVEKPVVPAVVETPKPEPVEAPPPPPPPPVASVAFKVWVENLRISGLRSGANPRVFIGGTSYAPGDLVNPQLGITFAGYDSETRLITFKDANGAKVERRD